jgi:hypothetical protein
MQGSPFLSIEKNKIYITSLEEQLWPPLPHAAAAMPIEEVVEPYISEFGPEHFSHLPVGMICV